MREPKETQVGDKTYILTKIPAIAGRKLVSLYPIANMPKIGDYNLSEEAMMLLMSYVYVKNGNDPIQLNTQAIIDNHVYGWEELMTLEKEMMVYNCSFFQNGKISSFLDGFAQIVQSWTSQTLTHLLEQLSAPAKRRSKS